MRTPEQQAILDWLNGIWPIFASGRRISREEKAVWAEQAKFSYDYLGPRWPLEAAEPPLADPPDGLAVSEHPVLAPGWYMPMPAFRISGLRYTPEHQAWDCNAPLGEPQRGGLWGSLKPGLVWYAGKDARDVPFYQNRGNHVIVSYENGLVGCACHFDELLVVSGDQVAGSQPIGKIGSTGYARGDHVHQWVERNGARFDWLTEGGYTPVQ